MLLHRALLLLLHDAEVLSICLLHRLQVASLTCDFASHPGFDTEGSCSNVVHNALKSSVSNFKYPFCKSTTMDISKYKFFSTLLARKELPKDKRNHRAHSS